MLHASYLSPLHPLRLIAKKTHFYNTLGLAILNKLPPLQPSDLDLALLYHLLISTPYS